MELFERAKKIKQSLISILDYAYEHNLAISSGIICVEVLTNEIPDTINIETITRDQVIKHYLDLSMYKFSDLKLVDTSAYISSCDTYNVTRLTYSTTYKTYEYMYSAYIGGGKYSGIIR